MYKGIIIDDYVHRYFKGKSIAAQFGGATGSYFIRCMRNVARYDAARPPGPGPWRNARAHLFRCKITLI